MKTLLATSDSISGIQQQLNKYFYSINYVVNEDLTISNPVFGLEKIKSLKLSIKETKLGYALYQN